MSSCCNSTPEPSGCASSLAGSATPLAWFDRMIDHCYERAREADGAGRPIVGILCEYTPRELILAAGALPICLCGGSAATIPAAEEHLPANLCPLIKSTYGYHVQRSNPFLEMARLIVAETTCDGKKKMYELMAETRPLFVLELPQRANEPEALEHWTGQLRRLKQELETRFGVEITDEKIRAAIRLMNRERRLRRELAELMQAAAPPLSGLELLKLKTSLSGVAEDLAHFEKALAYLREKKICLESAQKTAKKVRVLMTGVPVVSGAERVVGIIEECGGLVVAMENCTGLKPILEDVNEEAEDPIRALAEKYYHLPCSVMTPNTGRMESLRKLAAQYQPQCVIELVWQACLTYDVESRKVRRLAEEELGLPYLRIETDYSPSDTARIATRVEALLETVRATGTQRTG